MDLAPVSLTHIDLQLLTDQTLTANIWQAFDGSTSWTYGPIKNLVGPHYMSHNLVFLLAEFLWSPSQTLSFCLSKFFRQTKFS